MKSGPRRERGALEEDVDLESLNTETEDSETMAAEADDAAEVEEQPHVPKRALVIGGGIAGIQAALDLADARIPVTLVEKSPSLGGRMAQLDKTFPTMDCSI
ncbi:MAG: NAD(P)-binding protein [Acidobacteria bacterium]|jgi:heterodisulfide reductase subunit A-like polyferredoxin|nr:NAD(P)-binding protein [Acidobacteriota bacterium]